VGLLGGLGSGAAIAARPFLGRLLDARGRLPVIRSGAFLHLVVVLLYLTVSGIGPWIALVRIGHGLTVAALFAGFFTYAADVIPAARRTQGVALFGISGIGPVALGPLLGDWILAWGDYADLFAVSAAFAAFSLVATLALRDPPPTASTGEPGRGLLGPLRQVDLRPLWFAGTVFATAISAVFLFLKLFVRDTEIAPLGLFFAFYSGAAIFLRLGLGWLPDRAGPKRVLVPALGCLALGLASLAAVETPVGLAAAGVLCGLGHGMTFPILMGLVVTRSRPAERGASIALFTAVFDAGPMLGGPAFGWIARDLGYDALFASAGALLFAGAIVFALWDRGR